MSSRVAVDDCQEIVEVMRHSTSQPSDCLHLLSLAKLFFQLSSGGYVAQNPGELLLPVAQEFGYGQLSRKGAAAFALGPLLHDQRRPFEDR